MATSKVAQIKHDLREKGELKEDKHILIAVQEMEKYDGNPAARYLLMILLMGARKDPTAWIQPDCPMTAEEAIGWCDMAQWRLAQRVGLRERQIQNLLDMFYEDGAIERRTWRDENGALHGIYRVNEDWIRANERPSHKWNTPRPSRYAEGSRKKNKGSFTTANQPGRSAKQRAIMEADDE